MAARRNGNGSSSSSSSAATVLPAYDTKHVPVLDIPLRIGLRNEDTLVLRLAQADTAGTTTGTTLWLGAQVLSAYLLWLFPISDASTTRRGKAIELGSGIGLTSLCLAAAGFDTISTDLPILTEGLLGSNIAANEASIHGRLSKTRSVAVQALDWMDDPASWQWPDADKYCPPFDLIVTSDSIYSEVLVAPLLRTVKSLSVLSGSRASTQNSKECFPAVYLAYEHRDDAQYNSFLSLAEVEGFRIKRVPQLKIRKAVDAVLGWKDKSIYEGITVVQMKLQGVP